MIQTPAAKSGIGVKRVNREGLYEKVVDQLQELIFSRHFKVGDRLPGERELCEQFGVSRTVLREATKVLVKRGMLTIEPGRGTFVTLPGKEDIALAIELFTRARVVPLQSIIEVRRSLEPEIAYLAALRVKPEHIERIQKCIEEMDQRLSQPDVYIQADHELHATLAEATGNDLFIAITGVIVNMTQSSRKLLFQVTGAPGRGQDHHRLILQAVSNHDAAAARAAMLDHLNQIELDLALLGEEVVSIGK